MISLLAYFSLFKSLLLMVVVVL